MYGIALRAAVVKAWEFASFVNRRPRPRDGFFLTATLRGICEDLIALSFLDSLPTEDRDKAVSLLMLRSTLAGIAAQAEFFGATRPWQPVLQPGTASVASIDAELRTLATNLGWNGKQAWPSVWFMAKRTSLTPLYTYLYAATSRWVHFNPHLLLRMGWGGSEGNLGAHTRWHFTTKNFASYYAEFNEVYAVYLLVLLARGPGKGLVSERADDAFASLEKEVSKVLRWPEIVTYEEMNLEGPHQIQRLLLWAAYDSDADGPSAQAGSSI